MEIGRLLLRLTVGGFFFGHGTQKLFGWFGGNGLEETAQGLSTSACASSGALGAAGGLESRYLLPDRRSVARNAAGWLKNRFTSHGSRQQHSESLPTAL
jgi:hypothetical protein